MNEQENVSTTSTRISGIRATRQEKRGSLLESAQRGVYRNAERGVDLGDLQLRGWRSAGGVGSLESGTGHIEEMYRASLRRGAGLDEEQ